MWKGILGISLQEYLVMTPGEIMDQVSCWQIANGHAKQEQYEFIPDIE